MTSNILKIKYNFTGVINMTAADRKEEMKCRWILQSLKKK